MRWMCCSSRIVFSPGHCSVVICVLLPLIKNMYSLLSGDRGYTIMYPFTLLVFECIHYMIGTLAIHPDHKTYLTLHEIWFLEKCNHRLGDCFYYLGVKMINWCWEEKCFKCRFHHWAIFYTCSVSLCHLSHRSIVEDCDDSPLFSAGSTQHLHCPGHRMSLTAVSTRRGSVLFTEHLFTNVSCSQTVNKHTGSKRNLEAKSITGLR